MLLDAPQHGQTIGRVGGHSSPALFSAIIAWSMIAMTATATAGNRRGSDTDGAPGQRIKITAGVSGGVTSSTLSVSAEVIGPEDSVTVLTRDSLSTEAVFPGPGLVLQHRPGAARLTHLVPGRPCLVGQLLTSVSPARWRSTWSRVSPKPPAVPAPTTGPVVEFTSL